MLYTVFGRPGSGKSYYIVEEFIVKRVVRSTIISNIKLAKGVKLPNYNYLEKSELDALQASMKEIMDNEEKSHDEKKHDLAKLFSAFGELDITYIVDECHLNGYRGKSTANLYLDEFISIHRHIFGESDRKFDIVLITQVPSRLNAEIAEQAEEAIIAIPAPQRVVSSFLEYKVYASVSAMRKADKTMLMRSPRKKGREIIFDLYQSGFKFKGSGDFRRKLLIYGAIIVVAGLFTVNAFKGLVTGDSLPASKRAKAENVQISAPKGSKDRTGLPVVTEGNNTIRIKPHNFICVKSDISLQDFNKTGIIMLNGISQIHNGRIVEYCFWSDLQKTRVLK